MICLSLIQLNFFLTVPLIFSPLVTPSSPTQAILEASTSSYLMNSCEVPTPHPFTDWELDPAFASLNKKAAAEMDGISAPILQLSFPVIHSVLLHIFTC